LETFLGLGEDRVELLQKVTGQATEAAELAVKLMSSCNRNKLQEANVISVEKALDMLLRSLFRLVIRKTFFAKFLVYFGQLINSIFSFLA